MEFQGQERIASPRESVWQLIIDPPRYLQCIPRVQNVRPAGEGKYAFEIAAGGQVLKCEATWLQLEAPRYARMAIKGGDFLGRLNMTNAIELRDDGDEATLVNWNSDVQLGGILGKMAGDRVPSMIGTMNQEVIRCIERQLKEG